MPIPEDAPTMNRQNARAFVVDRLRDWIEDGTLAPGEVIKDVEIAERLGVSRTPVREALQLLGQLGAVETVAGKHTRISAAVPGDRERIYPVLAALHGLAAREATANITTTDLEALRRANEDIRVATEAEGALAARRADEEFHQLILSRASNPFLLDALKPVALHARRLDALYFTHLGPSFNSYADHTAITDAMERHDGDSAMRLMIMHWETRKPED
jgi:DNA-binding GntR family transcriptional regulator